MTELAISDLVFDQSIYPRDAVSEYHVGRLALALKTGVRLPPLTIEATTRRVIDGWHRKGAWEKEGRTTVEVIEKMYANDADAFADAVRLNIDHGLPLTDYLVRSAIIRLTGYGYAMDAISEVVRLPVDRLVKIEKGFASDASGAPVALKGGLSHLRGTVLDENQMEANKRYSGPKAVFHVNQVCNMLDTGVAPLDSAAFVTAMDRLTKLWAKMRKKVST